MDREDLEKLGVREYENIDFKVNTREKEQKGFVAGVALAEAREGAAKKT